MVWNFFSVIGEEKTYLNMLYLLISFPLGIIYFVLLVTGISLGLGLVTTLIGIPILVFMTFLWYWIAIFERQFTSSFLGIDIKSAKNNSLKQKTFWKMIKKHLSQPITWKSLAYLFIKFPLGIVWFVALVTLLSVSIGLIGVPIAYYFLWDVPGVDFMVINGVSVIPQVWQAILVGIIGVFFLFISMHILNGLAYVSGLFAKVLLSEPGKRRK